MHFGRGHIYKALILFIVFWTALAVVIGALNKADADLGAGSSESAYEIALKMCAVIFTAVATAASGLLKKMWRRLPVRRTGINRFSPVRLGRRYRPPPHGFALLRQLQVIIV